MNTDLNSLMRLNVELEGLLKVLSDRDSVHARTMLAEKFKEYSQGLQQYLAGGDSPEQENAFLEEAAQLEQTAQAVEVKDQEAISAEVEDETDAATEAIEHGEHTAEAEYAPVADAESENHRLEVAKEDEAVSAEVEDETDAATEAIEHGQRQTEENTETETNANLLKAFTLNDRFRFRRQLFNGDDDDFNDTLSLLAHMPDYHEAVDYLTHDLLWDTRNPDVQAFLDILKENMPQ